MSQQNPFQQGQPGPQPGQHQGQPQPGYGPQPGQPQPGFGPQPGAQPGFGPQPGAQPGYGPQAGQPGYGAQPGYAGAPGYGQAPGGANPYAAPTADLGGALEPGIEPPVELSTMEAVKWSFKATGLGNLAMGLLLLIIPMVGPVLLQGWMAQIHRRLVRREGPAVRSFQFDQFSDTLKAGLVPFLVQMAGSMIIMIPMMVIMVAGFAVITAVAAGGGGSVGGIMVGLGALGMFVVIMGLSLAAGVVLKAFTIRAELTGDLKAAFDFKAGMAMVKRQFKPMLVHMILLTLISIPLSFAGLLVFFIGVYIVAVALSFAQLHLRWQMYEHDIKSGGEVLEVYPGMGAKL